MDVKGEVIAMMGTWGWGIMLMCPGGTGKGCCGEHVTNSIGFWSENVTSHGACERQPSSTRGVTRGTWNHITVAVNSSIDYNEVHFYIDGAPAGSVQSNSADDFFVGSINMGSLRRDLKIGGGPSILIFTSFNLILVLLLVFCIKVLKLLNLVLIL